MMVLELRKYQVRIPRKILGRNKGLTLFLAQKLKNQFLGHVIAIKLRQYQIWIPRKILGLKSGLTFVLAQN